MVTPELQNFFAVLQDGEPQAVEELLRKIEPFFREVIRLRLIDGRLRHIIDTTDILQSLLKDFWERKRANRLPIKLAGKLHDYLAAAVRNKIRTRARKERRHAGNDSEDWYLPSREWSAAQRCEDRDLIMTIRDRLDDRLRPLFDLRAEGLSWPEIGQRIGLPHSTLRLRFTRAVLKIRSELGL